MSALFARLRSGTEQQHRDIETIVDPMRNFSSLGVYKTHLLATWRFYATLEADLAGVDWSLLGIDFASRQKAPLLVHDLRVLGMIHPSPVDTPPSPARTDLSFALGCMYVLEGATLGGQVISRHLATIGIGPANGGLFFNGYGAQTGAMWKSFQLKAAEYCVTDDQIEAAVHGAIWTFGHYRDSVVGRIVSRDAS